MSYYLIGGNKKYEQSKVLGLKVDDIVEHEFRDISDIDLQTTLIPRKIYREELASINEEFDKSKDSIFIAQYPYSKTESKLYYSIQDVTNPKGQELIKNLRVFASLRSEKCKNKDKVQLEPTKEFKDFAYYLMDDIIDEREKSFHEMKAFFSDHTLVLKYLKTKFDTIYNTFYSDVKNQQRDKILLKLQDYKALRNLIFEYSLYLEKENYFLRDNLLLFTKEDRNGHLIGEDFITESIKELKK